MEYLHTDKDGNQVKYTDEMIKNVITDLEYYKNTAHDVRTRNLTIRQEVYNFFNERYDAGDTEITCSVEDVNELLDCIGADKLKSLFTVSGRINFIITDIEADSEEDARDIVESELTLEFNGDGNLDEWDIDISDTSQQ